MTNQVIPAQAVEVVARWLYERNDEWGQPSWEDAPRDLIWKAAQDDFRQEARELLEAAAPHMLAEVWRIAYEMGESDVANDMVRENPYRPTP